MRAIISKKFEKLHKAIDPVTGQVAQEYRCKICGEVVKRKERLTHYNGHRFKR